MNWEDALALSNRTTIKYSLHEEQRKYLYRYCAEIAEGGTLVELGVCNGASSVVMAYVAKHKGLNYYGVDSFVLGDAIGEQGFHHLMGALDLPYTLLSGYTNDVPWNKPIDLLLIDASHTDPYVSQDCERWLPYVKGGGVAMFHDYDGAPEPLSAHWPVRAAVNRTTELWGMCYYIDGLMIKRRPQEVTYKVAVDNVEFLRPGHKVSINGDGFWLVLSEEGGKFKIVRESHEHPNTAHRYPYLLWKDHVYKMQKCYEYGIGLA